MTSSFTFVICWLAVQNTLHQLEVNLETTNFPKTDFQPHICTWLHLAREPPVMLANDKTSNTPLRSFGLCYSVFWKIDYSNLPRPHRLLFKASSHQQINPCIFLEIPEVWRACAFYYYNYYTARGWKHTRRFTRGKHMTSEWFVVGGHWAFPFGTKERCALEVWVKLDKEMWSSGIIKHIKRWKRARVSPVNQSLYRVIDWYVTFIKTI